jgi:ATP-binding cassette subfamily C protein
MGTSIRIDGLGMIACFALRLDRDCGHIHLSRQLRWLAPAATRPIMRQGTAMRRLLAEAPQRQTALLFCVMLVARLTEGIGLFLLVPMLEILSAANATSALSQKILELLDRVGVSASMGSLLLIFIGLIALRAALLVAQQTLSLRYQHGVVDRMRSRLFDQLLRAEWRWLVDQRASDLANLLTTGVGRIGVGLSQIISLIAGITTLLAYGIAAFILSWQVTLVTVAIGILAYMLFSRHRSRAAELGHILNGANRSVQASIQEGLSAVRLTKLSRAEERHGQEFAKVIRQLRDQQVAFLFSSSLGDAALQIGGAITLAALLYGGLTWFALPLSIMLTLVLIFARLMPVFASTQQSYHHWLHARSGLEEFEDKVAEATHHAEPASGSQADLLALTKAIAFRDVSFEYATGDSSVLQKLSFRIPVKTTTAVLGPSGSGKSTFADMLTGLLTPEGGRIMIDDVPLDAENRLRWRQSVTYVEQDSFLFHDTILANLKWAHPSASVAEIEKALQLAAADFVFELPAGINTIVGDAGQKLSGGERQRIALARALLAKPALLVLDEATSALDLENEALVHKALAQLRGQMTIIVIGHRLAGIDIADQILRFEKGKVQMENPQKVPT